jgi:hypothetical protein
MPPLVGLLGGCAIGFLLRQRHCRGGCVTSLAGAVDGEGRSCLEAERPGQGRYHERG